MKEAIVIIFIVTVSARKPIPKRKYTTARRLMQQHQMMKNKPTQAGQKKLSPEPDMNNDEEDVTVTDKGTKRRLNVESETDNDDVTRDNEADVQVFFSFHFSFIRMKSCISNYFLLKFCT